MVFCLHCSCTICHGKHDPDNVLLCDTKSCDGESHLGCLSPPLLAVPEGKWHCSRCRARGEGISCTATPPAEKIKKLHKKQEHRATEGTGAVLLGSPLKDREKTVGDASAGDILNGNVRSSGRAKKVPTHFTPNAEVSTVNHGESAPAGDTSEGVKAVTGSIGSAAVIKTEAEGTNVGKKRPKVQASGPFRAKKKKAEEEVSCDPLTAGGKSPGSAKDKDKINRGPMQLSAKMVQGEDGAVKGQKSTKTKYKRKLSDGDVVKDSHKKKRANSTSGASSSRNAGEGHTPKLSPPNLSLQERMFMCPGCHPLRNMGFMPWGKRLLHCLH